MKKHLHYLLFVFGLIIISTSSLFAQTGPAGVGNSTNNRIWLDAHSLGFADGSPVFSWDDLSGNESNFLQPASSKQPVYNTSGIGGVSSLTFDGVNDVMTSGAISGIETPNITYFMVYDKTTLTNDMLVNAKYASSPNKWRAYANAGQNKLIAAQYSPVIHWTRYDDPVGASFFSSHITPTNISLFNQGNLSFTRNSPYTVPTTHQDIYLGNISPNAVSTYTFTGEIAEFIVFNTALNPLERVLIENYLGAKYSLSIPDDRFDYEATHKFGVIGIADDGTNTQTVAQGADVLELSGATDMSAGEYFLVGHTDFSVSTYNDVDIPASLVDNKRLERTWRVGETGDVGAMTLNFKLGADNDFAVSSTYRLLVDEDGVFTDATIVEGTYDAASHSISFNVNLDDGDFFTLAGKLEILEIHSIVDGFWGETATWDCGCIPSANDFVFIDPSTTVTVNVDAITNYLSVESEATLLMTDEFTLDINGDWDIIGEVNLTGGAVSLTGSEAQNIEIIAATGTALLHDVILNNTSLDNVTMTGGTYNLGGTLFPQRGNLVIDPSTQFIVLSTSATEGGRVGVIEAPANISGNFSVQRFLPPGNADWRNLASPVSGATFSSWDSDLFMSGPGFPDGCAFGPDGCFKSIKHTNHSVTNDVLNISEEIENGLGYEVFVGDDLETFSGATITSTGPLNPSTDIVSSFTTGWTVIGNPYASPINFSTLNKSSQIGDYYYVYDASTGAYQWYDGASNTSSVPEITEDGRIAIGQGVWVFASSAGTITYTQVDKTDNQATFIRGAATVDESLALELSENNSTYSCTMYLEEVEGAADGLDDVLDIRHLSTGTEKGPSIAVEMEGSELIRKNFISKDGRDKSFELLTSFKNDGYYTLSLKNAVNFRAYSKILLFDYITGEKVDLKRTDYTFFTETALKNTRRFTLLLTNQQNGSANEVYTFTENSGDENITIKQLGDQIDILATEAPEEVSTVIITNLLGQSELFNTKLNLNQGSNVITLPNQLKGFYILSIQTGEKITTKKIML